jgi:hypothetical protein
VTITQDVNDFMMSVKLRLAELEARIRKLEAGEDSPGNLQGAHSSASAELSRNAAQRLHESKAGWR